jgi:hypothetical protein
MATDIDVMGLIDSELQKAAEAPKTNGKRPLFLFLKENHKALIRPLYDLGQSLALNKHSKWSDDASQRVNAMCAAEEAHPCGLCAKVENDKKIEARIHFYLPAYVYSVIDTATGEKITYKERQENGSEIEKPVSGVRVLELARFGTIAGVLKFFREYVRDEGPITGADFTITQQGSGQKKSFVTMPKAPRPMDEKIRALIPTHDRLRERLLEALPPVVANDASTSGNDSADSGAEDDIPDF